MSTPRPKTILLVDDDQIFLKGMMYTVKGLGHQVLLASGGREAVRILQQQAIDVIVSDINMPDGNGLQLLSWTKKNKQIPLILMTGLSDLQEAQRALELGARSFLTKPFKKNELSEAIAKGLCRDEAMGAPGPLDLISLHIEEFIFGSDMNFPIYLQTTKQLLKISAGGESLKPEVIRRCRESGIFELSVERDSYLSYLGFDGFRNQSLPADEKARWKKLLRENLAPFDFLSALNKNVYQRAFSQVDTIVEVLCDNSATLKILEEMKGQGDFLRRSVNVCFFSLLISQYAKLMSAREIFMLGFAGLFHEIGLLGTPHRITDLPRESLSAEEKEILLAHPHRGAERLLKVGHLPQDVALLIREHHEFKDGSGYPGIASGKELHRFTGIMVAGDCFALALEDRAFNQETSLKVLRQFCLDSLGKHETSILEALSLVFGQPLPQEFVQYQLGLLGREAI